MKRLSFSIFSASILVLMLPAVGIVQDENYTIIVATTDGNTTTGSTPNSVSTLGLEFSARPIWEEEAISTGMIPINETHRIVTFIGNGTITVPDTGENISMTNNGTAIISPVRGSAETFSAYGRESVFSEDGDNTTITFYEIIQYDPDTFEGKGIIIAVFERNATGMLAPFNGMMVAGTHYEQPDTEKATITLWEWLSD